VQPDGRRARAAIVEEGQGTLANVFDVAARVSGVVDERLVFVFVVFEEDRAGGGFVGDRLAGDFDGVIGNGRLFLGGFGRLFSGFFRGLGFFFLREGSRKRNREYQGGGAEKTRPEMFVHSPNSPRVERKLKNVRAF